MLVMTAEKAAELGYEPIARWVTCAHVGYYEDLMGLAPCYSNLKAMKHAGLGLDDIDVIECNEAFAAQNLGVICQMEKESGRTINQAKWLLVERYGYSEEQAHRHLLKQAMDRCVTKYAIAQQIVNKDKQGGSL